MPSSPKRLYVLLDTGREHGAEFVSLDDLLRQSDFVVVTCPLTEETRNMFNKSAFEKMKRSSVFVNVARGGIRFDEIYLP